MNFIFFSPNFPSSYWQFCDRLKQNGATVLGIGDAPYDTLAPELRASLAEYYRVGNPESYDEVYRAVAYFAFKYGKLDWIESNNEYWLEQDARLRRDFNIATGAGPEQMALFKSKRAMKEGYLKAKIPTPRLAKIGALCQLLDFAKEVGYPLIVKPEIGVGATGTWRLNSDEDARRFFARKPEGAYVTEEFVTGDICSYDAIANASGEPLFESMTVWPPSIADIVEKELDLQYYTAAEVPEALRKLGRSAIKAFGAERRFVHLEFFRLTKARTGLGAVGDFVGLEVNMRPAGGYTPDMMNFAHSTDCYRIWAEMVCFGERRLPARHEDHYCAYASRRDGRTYRHSHEEILARFGKDLAMCQRNPPMMWPQMGQQFYIAHRQSLAEVEEFMRFVGERI
ncbi:MAG: carbamoylphosphate synthase large subunit [Kiritimatiellia bacterium]|nr:carbamoylphosphate synthase large subunit [Kiritimatiellia bacterium]